MEQKGLLELVQPEGNQDDESCLTFVFNGEDHTLGNSLRYMVMKNPDTAFCGYNIPHPSENKINFRVQTIGVNAKDVLRTGLVNLQDACQHVLDKFEDTVDNFKLSGKGNISDEEDSSDESSFKGSEDSDDPMEDDHPN